MMNFKITKVKKKKMIKYNEQNKFIKFGIKICNVKKKKKKKRKKERENKLKLEIFFFCFLY